MQFIPHKPIFIFFELFDYCSEQRGNKGADILSILSEYVGIERLEVEVCDKVENLNNCVAQSFKNSFHGVFSPFKYPLILLFNAVALIFICQIRINGDIQKNAVFFVFLSVHHGILAKDCGCLTVRIGDKHFKSYA